MKELEANVRAIEKEGLVWGASKLVAVGFGIKKLQINLVVEDEKVSLGELQGQVEEDEDHAQSTDSVSHPNAIECLLSYSSLTTAVYRLLCKSYRPCCLLVFFTGYLDLYFTPPLPHASLFMIDRRLFGHSLWN